MKGLDLADGESRHARKLNDTRRKLFLQTSQDRRLTVEVKLFDLRSKRSTNSAHRGQSVSQDYFTNVLGHTGNHSCARLVSTSLEAIRSSLQLEQGGNLL